MGLKSLALIRLTASGRGKLVKTPLDIIKVLGLTGGVFLSFFVLFLIVDGYVYMHVTCLCSVCVCAFFASFVSGM